MDLPYRDQVLSGSFSCLTTIILLLGSFLALAEASNNETDRLALLEFKAQIVDPDGVLSSWNDSSHFCEWYGVTCGRRHRRVTALNLHDKNLAGVVSPYIGNLSFLRAVHLSDNSFRSEIPPQFGHLLRLQKLFLNGNSFSGQIPSKLSHCSNMLILNLSHNTLEGNLPGELGSLSKLQQLSLRDNSFTGNIPPSFGNLSSLQGLTTKFNNLDGMIPETLGRLRDLNILDLGVNRFSGGFSSTNLLGVGNFGSVYKGLLDQTQSIVAIKILDVTRHGASKSFIAECNAFRRIRHRNLVKVLTACVGFDFNGNDFMGLVYEFMSNGSLDEWLHLSATQYTKRSKLSLLERVNIAIDVACALDYLHHHCETPIVHCDLKPSNVLLDNEMTGHVGDFGLAKFLPEATHMFLVDQSNSIGLEGSFGYVAPEYGTGSAISIEGDVYSFGVLVLEMFTGKRPTDDMFENGLDLHRFAKAALEDQVEKVIDPVLLMDIQESDKRRTVTQEGKNKSYCSVNKCLVSIIEIGVVCSLESPMERMDVGNALNKLQGIREKLLELIVIA